MPINLSKLYILIIYPIVLTLFLYLEDYLILYVLIVTFLTYSLIKIKGFIRIISLFFIFYLSIGLLNISSWRGYIDVNIIYLYGLSVYFFYLSPLMYNKTLFCDDKIKIYNLKLLKIILVVHVSIAFLAVAYVYVAFGNVLLNQSLRFRIPTGIEYTIKSILPIAGLLPLMKSRRNILYLFLIILPAMLIGSRGTAVISLLAYVITDLYIKYGHLNIGKIFKNNKKVIFFGIVALSIISTGFYLRRSGESELASIDFIIGHYFDYDNIFVRLLLPFYLGFKETIGLSNTIINQGIVNNINQHSLFFADLFTVLPGQRLAAGQSLGSILGTVEGGGLTPGLLGGLYIDYQYYTFLFFFIFGLIFSVSDWRLSLHSFYIIIYSQLITQFIHLFHRGFLKPEYITSIMIAIFYYVLCHKIVTRIR